jgi:hypothetical protein
LPPGSTQTTWKDNPQFRISHLFVATVAVATLLGLGRLVLPEGPWRIIGLERELAVILPIIAVVNLIVVLPCVWGAFARTQLLVGLTIAWLIYAIAVSVVEVLVFTLFFGDPPGDVWVSMMLFNVCQCLCVFGTLVCLRGIGFRLRQFDKYRAKATHEGIDVV